MNELIQGLIEHAELTASFTEVAETEVAGLQAKLAATEKAAADADAKIGPLVDLLVERNVLGKDHAEQFKVAFRNPASVLDIFGRAVTSLTDNLAAKMAATGHGVDPKEAGSGGKGRKSGNKNEAFDDYYNKHLGG